MSRITLNRLDYERIKRHLEVARQLKSITNTEADKLLGELESAQVVNPESMPSDVVTMNSIVKISFWNAGKEIQFRIVYPHEANLKESKISIFSPIATALIGYRVGDEIEWLVPAGPTKIRIEEIVYQPEASGNFTL